MNIVIGKRIPIGAAVNGLVIFAVEIYNMGQPPSLEISLAVAGGIAVTLTALVQIWVVHYFGVTGNGKTD